jgi:hypothetical protein
VSAALWRPSASCVESHGCEEGFLLYGQRFMLKERALEEADAQRRRLTSEGGIAV